MSETGARRNIWFVLSLCLNVVLIAMLAVGFVRMWQRGQESRIGGAFSAQSIVAHLPADGASRVQAVVGAHAARLNALAAAAEQARLHARIVFTASNFEAADFAQAQAGIRAADDALEAERHRQLNDIAVLLTPDERQAIVERARHQVRKR